MENYIVSARKYRPTTFASVVGQEVLTQTLRNAIDTNHLAHAYLFCGPRGVGKTTCARIFAKTINCLNPTANHEACNECDSCRDFNEQRSMNIHELDAASNNSVEDMRTLIEQTHIPPQIGKYSVFIIDEVHMLSTAAFNALLKTLEEPPSYVIFILATTEKHKVLPTIISRCQVYDFTRITINDTIHHLQYVAKNEGVNATEEALNVVAQKADGGMRDALSIFDQLVSFCGKEISYEQAIEVLNVLDTDYYFRLVDCFLQGNVSQSLLIYNEILSKGFDSQNFLTGLASHLRDVLVSKDPQTVQLLETSGTIKQHYAQQATTCSVQFLFKALGIINDCDINYKMAKNKRLSVEIMLIKLCQILMSQDNLQQPQVSIKPIPAQPQNNGQTSVAKEPLQSHLLATSSVSQTQQPQANVSQPQINVNHSQIRVSTPSAPTAPKIPSISIRTSNIPTTTASTTQTSTASSNMPIETIPINNNSLNTAWQLAANLFPKDERFRSIMHNAKLTITGQNSFNVEMVNEMQKQEMMNSTATILEYLRKELHNSQLSITYSVCELQDTGAYTVEEKIKALSDRNTEFNSFIQQTGLQIE